MKASVVIKVLQKFDEGSNVNISKTPVSYSSSEYHWTFSGIRKGLAIKFRLTKEPGKYVIKSTTIQEIVEEIKA